MANETEQTEMVEPKVETPAQPEPKAAEIATDAKDAKELEAELEKVRKALKDANSEAAAKRKRLEEFEKAEEERKLAQMSEQEKLQAQLKQLEAALSEKEQKLKFKERQDLQNKVARAVAKELGLDRETAEGLSDRLKGETEEEITEDAKIVFALLPKQEAKKPAPPKIDPTNPGSAVKGETRAQTRERTLGTPTNPWQGGSVRMVEKE